MTVTRDWPYAFPPGHTAGKMRLMAISLRDSEQARRRRQVDQARASSALEGLRSDDDARHDQEAYTRGEIDVDELVARARARAVGQRQV